MALDRKVIISLLTSGVKLLALLGSPCCVILCCCRFLVGLANSSQAASCCEVVASSSSSTHPQWLEEGTFLSSPLTELAILRVHPTPYRSRATVAAFRVPPTPYRPRVTVAAMYHIAAAAQAVKRQFPSLVPRRQLSFRVRIRHGMWPSWIKHLAVEKRF